MERLKDKTVISHFLTFSSVQIQTDQFLHPLTKRMKVSPSSTFLFTIFSPIVNMKIEMELHVAHANRLLNNGMASTV